MISIDAWHFRGWRGIGIHHFVVNDLFFEPETQWLYVRQVTEGAEALEGRPVAALLWQPRSPSAIVARQSDTIGHGPGHCGSGGS